MDKGSGSVAPTPSSGQVSGNDETLARALRTTVARASAKARLLCTAEFSGECLRESGRVEIPQDAFLAVLKVNE